MGIRVLQRRRVACRNKAKRSSVSRRGAREAATAVRSACCAEQSKRGRAPEVGARLEHAACHQPREVVEEPRGVVAAGQHHQPDLVGALARERVSRNPAVPGVGRRARRRTRRASRRFRPACDDDPGAIRQRSRKGAKPQERDGIEFDATGRSRQPSATGVS
jgi:hypothetical protein